MARADVPEVWSIAPWLSDSPRDPDLGAVLQKRGGLNGKGLVARAGHSPWQDSLGLLIGLRC